MAVEAGKERGHAHMSLSERATATEPRTGEAEMRARPAVAKAASQVSASAHGVSHRGMFGMPPSPGDRRAR